MSEFLLEIGTEEIPHWMIPGALAQLAKIDVLGEALFVDATPRRLVLRATGVPERTPDEQQIIKGPPISAGDKAAAGFAKKQGVELSAMQKVGDYYELRKHVPGRRAIDILAETLPTAIMAIQWPKTMYWVGGKTGPRFIRPIRWIVALLGDEVVPFEIAGVKSGKVTRGHRQLGAAAVPVTIANYESELRKNFVILSSDERRKKIESEAAALGAKPDADLLETLTFVTEFPTAIRGDFDPAFLALPSEVLSTVLKHHQKTFSIESSPGNLAPHFVAIMNTSADPDGWVKLGNERVIKARFNDARFFFDVDQHKKLADRVADLAKVTFHAKLGSYLEKTKRMVEIVKELNGGPDAERAALLCKADLTTEMVKEFTDLQGIVGGLYAKHQGESEAVSRAIYEHYKPLNMESEIPLTVEGQIVALADKVDTLRECFKIGLEPTGSKDPFALRRAAGGVVKILSEGAFPYGLDHLSLGPEAYRFVLERARFYFLGLTQAQFDVLSAVQEASRERGALARWKSRLALAEEFRNSPIVASVKRISKILGDFTPTQPLEEGLIEPGQELDLYNSYERVRSTVYGIDERAQLTALESLVPQIESFFDHVMVNVDDTRLRTNRKTLLYRILHEASAIVDFSKLVTTGEK